MKYLPLLLLIAAAHAQTPIPEAPNMVTVCSEPCVVTAVSNASAVMQFGIAATWGPTFTLKLAQLPLSVNYASPNLVLSPFDPAPRVTKSLAAQQTTFDYAVSWTLGGVTHTTPVPALAVPVVTPVASPLTFAWTLTLDATGKPVGATCTPPVVSK